MKFLFGIFLLSLGIGIGPLMAQNQKESDKASEMGMIIPSGTIMPYAGATAPAGWVFAAGQEYNTTGTYAKLFAAIGSAYCTNDHGAGGACTTGVFRLPDLRGRFVGGRDNMNGIAANRITAAKTLDATILGKAGGSQNVAGHYHGMGSGATLSVDVNHDHEAQSFGSGNESANHTHAGETGTEHFSTTFGIWYDVPIGGTRQDGGAGQDSSRVDGSTTHTHSFTTGGVSAPHTHTTPVDLAALGVTSKTPTGSVGLVTGGCDGNSDSCSNLSPTIILNYIIKL
jgi:microcystin-dependent protein